MKKSYENEIKLVESLLNNYNKVYDSQLYIKEQFGLSSYFDKNISLLYVWDENKEDNDNVLEAEKYIKENFNEYLLDVDIYKPDTINENEEDVYVVYLGDKTTETILPTEDDAKKEVDKLNKEYEGNNATYKKEKRTNYVKQKVED